MNETDFALVAIGDIAPSPNNPRRSFNPSTLQQLADSIKEKGVLEPILVRPKVQGHDLSRELRSGFGLSESTIKAFLPYGIITLGDLLSRGDGLAAEGKAIKAGATAAGRVYAAARSIPGVKSYEAKALSQVFDGPKEGDAPAYELVAGERRWRAAKIAGLTEIPALIRQLSDKEAAEVQVIENDQREDVPPLEQAAGYQRLIELGDDVETIATKIGRPPRYVFARLQLTKLIEPLQEDLAKGWISFGHAHLLARLSPADQRDARDQLLWQFVPRSGDPEGLISIDQLRSALKRSFVRDLSQARWKLDDAKLVAEAGACTVCPKRMGHNPSLFEGLLNGERKKSADYCLDGACYNRKRGALIQLFVRSAKQKTGQDPLLLTTNYFRSSAEAAVADAGFERGKVLTADQYEVVPARMAKDDPQARAAVIVEDDGMGRAVYVKLKERSSSSDVRPNAWRLEERRRVELLKTVGRAAFQRVKSTQEAERLWDSLPKALQRLLGLKRIKLGWIANACGVEPNQLEQFLVDGSWSGRTGFLVATCLMLGNATHAYAHTEFKDLLAATGVDVKKVKASLRQNRTHKKPKRTSAGVE